MAVTSRVQAVFSANASGLTAGTKRAATALDELRASVGRLQGSMSTLVAINGAQLFGSIVTYASQGVRSMLTLGQSTAETVDRMSKLAATAGQTYAEFAGLAFAGDLAGVGMDALSAALRKSDRVFVDAQRGAKTAQDAFASIGLSVDQLVGKTSAERFEQIAGAINALPDPAQKTAAAMKIFGKSGADLLPLFATGAEGIRQAREEFERFGGALTNTQATNVEEMNDAWTRVKASIQGIITQVVAQLSPGIKTAFDTLSAFVAKAGGASIGASIAEAIFDGAEVLAIAADGVWQQLTGAWGYASQVSDQFNGVVTLFSRATAGLNAAFSIGVAAFKGVASLMLEVAAQISGLLSKLPKSLVGEGWDTFSRELSKQAEAMGNEATKASQEAVQGAWAALSGDMGESLAGAIEKPAGTLESLVERMRQSAADAASATGDQAAASIATGGELAAQKITAAAKVVASVSGVDARSTAGINQIVNAINGRQTDAALTEAKKQTALLRDIANKEDPPDEEVDF